MGGDNNWQYFTCCPIVTASCSFYGEEMSGFWHNWLFYGDFMSLFTLWGVLVSGIRCSPKGPRGWLVDILLVCVGGGCLMIRYCIAYWLMGLRPKPGVVGVILAPNLTIFIHTLRVGDNRVGNSLLSLCWWMAAVGANPGLFFIHFHTAVLGGRGLPHCLGVKHPSRVREA